MLSEGQENQEKKRVLKKVRRDFLNKKLNGDEIALVDPSAKYISNTNVYTLCSVNGIMEANRKILIGPQYLNGLYTISSFFVEEQYLSKPVTISISGNTKGHSRPQEYTIKRLESYGDLELATWAHRILKFYQNYPKKMAKFYKILNSDDPVIIESIKASREKARLACAEIESNFMYYKAITHLRMDTTEMTQISYSEGFLKEIGHSTESFLLWIKNNGIPQVFDSDCCAYLQSVKTHFDESTVSDDCVRKGEEYEVDLIDKRGAKKKIIVQNIIVVEPDPKDSIIHVYYILKNNSLFANQQNSVMSEEHLSTQFKQTKIESHQEDSHQPIKETIMNEHEK